MKKSITIKITRQNVLDVCPWLTDQQASEVLEAIEKRDNLSLFEGSFYNVAKELFGKIKLEKLTEKNMLKYRPELSKEQIQELSQELDAKFGDLKGINDVMFFRIATALFGDK